MRKLMLLFLLLLILPAYAPVSAQQWLSGWEYRRAVTINNTLNGNTLTGFQVLVTVNTTSLIKQGKMRPDGGDIRFTDSDGTTLLPYWIEPGTINTSSTRIWVKVPYIYAYSNKTIFMYYGNPTATNPYKGEEVFDFFDDFSTGLNTFKWGIWQEDDHTTISVHNGMLDIYCVSWSPYTMETGGSLYAKNALPSDWDYYVIVARVKRTAASQLGEYGPGVGFTNNNTLVYDNIDYDDVAYPRNYEAATLFAATSWGYGPGLYYNGASILSGGTNYHSNVWYRIELHYKKGSKFWAHFYPEGYGDFVVNWTSSMPTEAPLYPFLAYSENYRATGHAYFDYIFVAKGSDPKPIVSVDPVEVSSSGAAYVYTPPKPPVPPSKWLSGWKYRKPITIDATKIGIPLTDFQVELFIDTASLIKQGKMKPDCSDIRFTDSDGVTLLNYWIADDKNTNKTLIYVKVPLIPADSTKIIYMYYGNPAALDLSNPESTMVLYDDFSVLNTSKWFVYTYGNTQISVHDHMLDIYVNDPSGYAGGCIVARHPLPDGSYVIVAKVKRTNYAGVGEYGAAVGFTDNLSSFNDEAKGWPSRFVASSLYINTQNGIALFTYDNKNGYGADVRNAGAFKNNTWYRVVLWYFNGTGANSLFDMGNGSYYSGMLYGPPAVKPYYPFLAYEEYKVAGHALFDFFVKKTSDPEPTFSVGTEEYPPPPEKQPEVTVVLMNPPAGGIPLNSLLLPLALLLLSMCIYRKRQGVPTKYLIVPSGLSLSLLYSSAVMILHPEVSGFSIGSIPITTSSLFLLSLLTLLLLIIVGRKGKTAPWLR